MKRILILLLVPLVFFALPDNRVEGNIVAYITGVVESVDLTDVRAPIIVIHPTDADAEAGAKAMLQLSFTLTPERCIDWNLPENRKMALVFLLEPGQMVRAPIPLIKKAEMWNQTRIPVQSILRVSTNSARWFPGWEKISDPSLITDLAPEEPRMPVIVVLKTEEMVAKPDKDEAGKAEDPKAIIKRMRNQLMEAMPKGTFQPGLMMENVPVMAGEITLTGLKTLAAHPLVEAIEPDRPMEPMPVTPPPRKTEEKVR